MNAIDPQILTRKSICEKIEIREKCIHYAFSHRSEQALSSCLSFKDDLMTEDASV
jgi:hypothetical protein